MKACIIVPCFNEELRLKTESFIEFSKNNLEVHFLFVNDGSSDRTVQVLKDMTMQSPQCNYLDLPVNRGKAGAVREGMLHAYSQGYTHMGYLDADLTIPLKTARELLDTLVCKEVDFIFASRTKRFKRNCGQTIFRQTIGYCFSLVSRTALRLPVRDTQCGAKFFTSRTVPDLFDNPFISKWIFDVEIFFRFKEKFENFFEFPLDHWDDNQTSKLRLRDFVRVPYNLAFILFYYL